MSTRAIAAPTLSGVAWGAESASVRSSEPIGSPTDAWPWVAAIGIALGLLFALARIAIGWRRRIAALEQERARLERDLLRAKSLTAVGENTLGVAHDFNNLLTAIVGYAEIAAEKLGPSQPARAELTEIQTISRHASDLVRELLRSSRDGSDAVASIDLDERLGELRDRILALVQPQVSVEFDSRAKLAQVGLAPARLDQIVLNLVLNARDAIPDVGALLIETSRGHRRAENDAGEEFARIRVRDDGSGMSEEVRQRIFEPFFSTKSEGQGSGLGLATVHTIVRSAGGHVVVESRPDEGSTFDVYLPCRADSAVDSVDAPELDCDPASGGLPNRKRLRDMRQRS